MQHTNYNFRCFQNKILQDRTAARMAVVSLSCSAYHKMLRLIPKSNVGGIPWPEAYHIKFSQRRRLHRNSLPNEDFRLKRLYQPEKSLPFFKFNLQTSLFNLLSSNYILQILSSNCTLQILFSKVHSSNSIFNFNIPF